MTKIDISDLLLDPPERKPINKKYIYIFLGTIILFVILLSINSISKYISNKKETKKIEIYVKKETKKIEKINIKDRIFAQKKEIVEDKTIITKNTRYIQISAFLSKNKDEKLLRKIKNNDFKYMLKKGDKYTRVFVGPYKNYEEAKNDLEKAKRTLRKDAFITSKF